MTRVGIIANPASGKDIRRLVAHASTFDNNEKINIVRRVLLALDALGVECVSFMPDTYAIVQRAAEDTALRLQLEALPMAALGNAGDSREAARRLLELEAGALVTLGGDGTNRAVAGGCGAIPLVPISTGTNNVFPRMVEGTLAGLAAGLVATGAVVAEAAVRRVPRLDVVVDGKPRDLALIDAVTSRRAYIGARALWEAEHVAEVVLSRVTASEIGLCALGGIAFPAAIGSDAGVHLQIGDGGEPVMVPLGPGLLREVHVREARLIAPRRTRRVGHGLSHAGAGRRARARVSRPAAQLGDRLRTERTARRRHRRRARRGRAQRPLRAARPSAGVTRRPRARAINVVREDGACAAEAAAAASPIK